MMETEIVISSLAGLEEGAEDADIVLVGPQVRCALASVREWVPVKVPVLAVDTRVVLSLIHISEPTRQEAISYAVFCLKKKPRTAHETI